MPPSPLAQWVVGIQDNSKHVSWLFRILDRWRTLEAALSVSRRASIPPHSSVFSFCPAMHGRYVFAKHFSFIVSGCCEIKFNKKVYVLSEGILTRKTFE